MSLIRKHVAVLQAWACLALVYSHVFCRPDFINHKCTFIYLPRFINFYSFQNAQKTCAKSHRLKNVAYRMTKNRLLLRVRLRFQI